MNILEKWRNLALAAYQVQGLSSELLLFWHYVASLNSYHIIKIYMYKESDKKVL